MFQRSSERPISAVSERLHYSGRLFEQYGRPSTKIDSPRRKHMGSGSPSRHISPSVLLSRAPKLPGGPVEQIIPPVRVVPVSLPVPVYRQSLRPSYNRQVRIPSYNAATEVQLPVLRSSHQRGGRPCPAGLGRGSELRQPPVPLIKPGDRGNHKSESPCYSDSPHVGGPPLVPPHEVHSSLPSPQITASPSISHTVRSDSGTSEKQAVENLCLESVWRKNLISKNWSDRAAGQFIYHLAQSTISQYNRYISNYSAFCQLQGLGEMSNVESVVADYLCSICDKSDRPKSVLTANVSALNKYFTAVNMSCVGENIHVFVQALIKSGTKSPMHKTPVMPVEAFFKLFNSL